MANNSFSVDGRKVLVVGGTRGIGRAIAWRLAENGAQVIATYVRDRDSAQSLADQARANGLQLTVYKADVTRDTAVNELLGHVSATLGNADAMVYSAATGVHKPVLELTGRQFDFTFSLNVRAFLELATKIAPLMPKGGTIVALTSEGAHRGIPTYALVGASKAAVESLVRNMAVELAPRGLTVNALSPGSVLTDAWKALPDSALRLQQAQDRSPRHRLTELDEVADAALFLCSRAARGISARRS